MGKLTEMLLQNSGAGPYPLHMPGHKRAMEWNINPYAYDITEISGFDDLHDPKGVLAELNGRLAGFYRAEEALLTVNGSTSGVLAAISAAVKPGGRLLLDRGSHRSAYNAVFLRRLGAEYVYPGIDGRMGINIGFTAGDVDKLLQGNRDISAVFVTSPTYEGVTLDIRGIAEAAHARGIPLIVDAAHGAHFGRPGFPPNPVTEGADVTVMSLHKTLPALTQTAVICLNGERVDREAVKRYFDIYVSSSPSYLLMASAERCMDFLDEEGTAAFEKYGGMLKAFRDRCAALRNLCLWEPPSEAYDMGKIVIAADGNRLSGPELAKRLRSRYSLEPELVSSRYVLAMTSCMDGPEAFERLWTALCELDGELGGAKVVEGTGVSEDIAQDNGTGNALRQPEQAAGSFGSGAVVVKRYDAWETEGMEWEPVSLDGAAGRTAADYVFVYPPGAPWLVPGEIIDRESVRRIKEYRQCGLEVKGITPEGGIRVLAEK